MTGFNFAGSSFEPLLRIDDHFRFMGQGGVLASLPGIYKVTGVEPIQPYEVDFIQLTGSGVTSLAPNGTLGSMTNVLDKNAMKSVLATDINTFSQMRIEPLDDILISLAAPANTNDYFITPYIQTYISKRLPVHRATLNLSAASTSDQLLWANTAANILSGNISGMTPTRFSRIVGLWIYVSGATTIFFGDAPTGGGSKATAASGVGGITFTAAGDRELGRDVIPESFYFNSGIVCQSSGAVTAIISASVEEDQMGLFGGNYLDEKRATSNQQNEFYAQGLNIPAMQVINPLKVTQATARAALAGWQFSFVEAVRSERDMNVKAYVPLTALAHQGPPK